MEKDVVKFLQGKGKSEQFINLILKIIESNCVKTNKAFDILKSML